MLDPVGSRAQRCSLWKRRPHQLAADDPDQLVVERKKTRVKRLENMLQLYLLRVQAGYLYIACC